MEEFSINEYPVMENTDVVVNTSNEENTDSEQILINLSDEFIDECKLNTNNNWYCLPYILSNSLLSSQKDIESVTSSEVGDVISIKVKYKPYFVKNNISAFDNEVCEHYIDDDVLDTVSYVVPKDKEYICKMIIQKGINVMDTDFIKRYILA